MNITALSTSFALVLFVVVFLGMEVGRRIGKRQAARDAEGGREGVGVVNGAIFGLLGLLIAFCFSAASSRFEGRRDLIVAEANAIGTAWLRLDLWPTELQPEVRESFRRYTDLRIEIFRRLHEPDAARAAFDQSRGLQGRIWQRAVEFGRTERGQPLIMPVLGSLNEMFDAATRRNMAIYHHTPALIIAMIAVVSLVSAALAGFGMAGSRRRSWLHILGFSAVLSVTVYVILDLEYPRRGLIRVDDADRALVEVRESMR